MSKLERLQKYIIVLILLLSVILAVGMVLLLQKGASGTAETGTSVQTAAGSSASAGSSTFSDSDAASSDEAALTDVQWYYPDHLQLGQVLTAHSFTLPDGGSTTLEEHLGSGITLAMYWGSWCSYCEAQTELLLSMQEELSARGVSVLLIDKMDPEKESPAAARQTIAKQEIPFDWVMDSDLAVYEELGLHIIPTLFLLDDTGRVLYCHAGVIDTAGELGAMLDYAEQGGGAQTLAFVQQHLMTEDGGVKMHAQPQSASSPCGWDVLSESQGLLMEYAFLSGDAALFETAYGYVQKNLDADGLLRWYGTDTEQTAGVNSLLDDLRVLRALDEWNQEYGGYEEALSRHSGALAAGNLDENGNLVDFCTFSDGAKAHRLTMCYADWEALEVLTGLQPDCASAVQKAQDLVDGAYLGDDFPFYANYYDYDTGLYDTGSLNMAEALFTLLHQARAGRLPEASLQWLRTQMSGNGILARYDIHGNVVPGYEYQSPAVYALTGLIAIECEDDALLTQAVSRMESFRCFDEGNPLNGAFAPSMEEVSSFDQCMALVLYAEMGR